jgi:hypothetical protein
MYYMESLILLAYNLKENCIIVYKKLNNNEKPLNSIKFGYGVDV